MKKLTLLSLFFLSASACSAPNPIYKASGQYGSEKYIFEIAQEAKGLRGITVLKINGEEAFRHKWKNLYREPTCVKMAVASWKCSFTKSFKDKKFTIVYATRSTVFSNSDFFEIYLNDEFIRQINATINT